MQEALFFKKTTMRDITEIGLYSNGIKITHSAGETYLPAGSREVEVIGTDICFQHTRPHLDFSFTLADVATNAIKDYTQTPTASIAKPSTPTALADLLRPFFFLS